MEEETAEDDRKTGDLSINYNAVATRDGRRNSMQRRTNMRRSRVRETRSVWRCAHEKSNISNRTEGSDGGESEPTPRPLKHDPGRQQGSLPATSCLHTCLSTCQLCISHGWCSRGARLRADTFRHRGPLSREWDGGYVARDQSGSASTAKLIRAQTFTTKPLRPNTRWAQRLLCRFHFGSSGSEMWERGGGASVLRNEK